MTYIIKKVQKVNRSISTKKIYNLQEINCERQNVQKQYPSNISFNQFETQSIKF